MDRRIARTRTKLHDALLSLIAEQGYEPTAVKDICERAGISRSAFYANYATKDDLMRSGLGRLRRLASNPRRDRSAQGDPGDTGAGIGLRLLRHARDHVHLHEHLGDRGVALVHETLRDVLAELVRRELPASRQPYPAKTMSRALVVQYIVGAYIAVITWWLEGGARIPEDKIDVMLRRLAVGGIAGLDRM